jgi:hypothetical protein
MKPAELFDVVVRSIGLLLILLSMPGLAMGFLSLVGGDPLGRFSWVFYALCMFLLGIWFIRGASGLAVTLYAEKSQEEEPEDQQ